MTYSYYLTQRPVGPGTIPEGGLFQIENFETCSFVTCIGKEAYAKVTYVRQLTKEEIENYELIPETFLVPLSPMEITVIRNALQLDAVHGNGAFHEADYELYKRLGKL